MTRINPKFKSAYQVTEWVIFEFCGTPQTGLQV